MNALKNEIPKCFHKDLIFASHLIYNQHKSVLFLLKNYTLYEIQCLRVIHTINLKDYFKEILCNNLQEDEQSQIEYTVTLGKYVLNNGISSSTRLFVLLKITDKLVILERKTNGYTLIKEFSNVDKFEVSDLDKLYQAHIFIYYTGEINPIKVSLEDDLINVEDKDNANVNFPNDDKIKELLQIIKKARENLNVKTAETKKIFLNIKNTETFGCNFIRSHVIEEKLILSRCGDIWMKVHNDLLVIGIPIANNCCTRLTTLQNIRPILNFQGKGGFEFQYRLYEITKGGNNFKIDSLETSDNPSKSTNLEEEWIPIKIRNLRPDTSAIITITVSLNNFYNLSCNEIICFITYDIFHENLKFTQNLFVKKFEIQTEILYKNEFQLDLSINSAINFLTIAATSTQHGFVIAFPESKPNCFDNLKKIFIEQLQFNQYQEHVDAMEIDNEEGELSEINKLNVFYKFDYNVGNFWYGTVVIFNQLSENKFKMKIYSRSASKTVALIQLLYRNSIEKIKIIPENFASTEDFLHNFEYALREELNLVAEITNEHDNDENILRKTISSLQQKLYAKQLQTDACINQLKENLNPS